MHVKNGAGVLAAEQGDFDAAARATSRPALELARALGAHEPRIAGAVTNLATLAIYAGDYEDAIARYEEAAAISRELGDERQLSLVLQNVGIAHEGAGHRDRAIEALEESLALASAGRRPGHMASTQRTLARLLLDDDPRARAGAPAREPGDRARIARRPQRDRRAVGDGSPRRPAGARHGSAVLWGAAGALRAGTGAIRQPDDEIWAGRAEAALREALGPEFDVALREGAALSATRRSPARYRDGDA